MQTDQEKNNQTIRHMFEDALQTYRNGNVVYLSLASHDKANLYTIMDNIDSLLESRPQDALATLSNLAKAFEYLLMSIQNDWFTRKEKYQIHEVFVTCYITQLDLYFIIYTLNIFLFKSRTIDFTTYHEVRTLIRHYVTDHHSETVKEMPHAKWTAGAKDISVTKTFKVQEYRSGSIIQSIDFGNALPYGHTILDNYESGDTKLQSDEFTELMGHYFMTNRTIQILSEIVAKQIRKRSHTWGDLKMDPKTAQALRDFQGQTTVMQCFDIQTLHSSWLSDIHENYNHSERHPLRDSQFTKRDYSVPLLYGVYHH